MLPSLLLALLLGGLSSPSSVQAEETPAVGKAATARPNMVVVLVDDLRWDELGCTGHPFVRTPHIDRIANEGARFRNAFCTVPLCSPSRACILTGQHAHTNGIVDNTDRSAQSHQLTTFPALLDQAGYVTAFIGKWHMGNDATARPGFDRWVCLAGQGTSNDPQLNVQGKEIQRQGYTTDILTEYALEFLALPHEQPFCLFLAHKALHPELVQYDDGSISDPGAAEFIPAKRHQQLYTDAPVPRRLNVLDNAAGKPALLRQLPGVPPLSRQTGTSDKTVRDRLRMLAAVDEGLGAMLQTLEKSSQLDNTIVVVLSDHGYFYGEHGLSVERRLAYEETARIPLLIRYPASIPAGTLIDPFALTIDLAPTLLQLAGAKVPAGIEGRSLVGLFQGAEPADWRKAFLIEYYSDTVFPRIAQMGYQALRSEKYKYIRYLELPDADELYLLTEDPYEMQNRIHDPKAKKLVHQLRRHLDELAPERK
ncbi:sulfatase family protein [Lignipirellula cremea]|uniref:sulfatase family protein n=1 Tax=Lignipirellula cremea TaxID=2528010 RepID=UPI0018D1FBAB|nr:sulfatase [Lignipirellula cremea]